MKPISLVTFLSAFLLFLAGCTPVAPQPTVGANVVQAMGGGGDEGYARALEPVPFVFPLDHGPHPEYRTEWWYYTGNLSGEDGVPYGYQLTFFRSAVSAEMAERDSDLATNQIYMAHFALTDGGAGEHHSFDRFSRGAGDLAGATGLPTYQVWLEDWSAAQTEDGRIHLQAQADGPDGPVQIDLLLAETRPPILHGNRGLSQKGAEPGNASYYYSLAGLTTSGTVTRDGRSASVTGVSWFDHEFGTSALSEESVGWDWFSAQLDNGALLMFAAIRTDTGQSQDVFEGTLVYPDGRQEIILPEDFELTPTGQWTSPETEITYPSGWEVLFPEFDIQLTISPLIPNQEMEVAFVYWEGASVINGSMQGQPVQGRGYVELTGYGAGGGYQR